ncbi:MliC family protein [Neisseriaceae bacterium TC5R-5]|nr:MliC family protein [Neisseriaceae bacterium TC5R-5]
MNKSIVCLLLSLLITPVFAQSLQLPQIQIKNVQTSSYRCDNGKKLVVKYLNAKNEQSFALLTIQGRPRLLTAVIAGSGVKYVADHYVWWTKGRTASLFYEGIDKPTDMSNNCEQIN